MNRADARTALLLAANVLGVGLLFLPWAARAVYGEAAVAGWLYLVVAGGLLVFALSRAVGMPAAAQGAATLAGRALGEPFGRVMRAFYAVGVTAGQTVVALVGAGFLAQAVGLDGQTPWWTAALVTTAATMFAASGRRVPARLTLPLFALVMALTLSCVLLSRRHGFAQAAPDSGFDWELTLAAAVSQLFVVVGWESTPAVLARTGARRARGPVSAVVLVGGVYALVLLAAGASTVVATAPGLMLPDLGPGAGRAVAFIAGLTATLFCARNLSTAAECAIQAMTGTSPDTDTARKAVLAAGLLALLGTVLVHRAWLDAIEVLSVPNTMALLVFLAVAVSLAIVGRRSGIVAGAAHLPLSFFTGPALAIPLLLLGALTGQAAARRARAAADTEEVHTVRDLAAQHSQTDELYLEFLRTRSLSAGLYAVPSGTPDPQQPHAEDELYVVLEGQGVLVTRDDAHPVERGSVIHVPAGLPHHFADITEHLHALVIFVPPESSPSADTTTREESSSS